MKKDFQSLGNSNVETMTKLYTTLAATSIATITVTLVGYTSRTSWTIVCLGDTTITQALVSCQPAKRCTIKWQWRREWTWSDLLQVLKYYHVWGVWKSEVWMESLKFFFPKLSLWCFPPVFGQSCLLVYYTYWINYRGQENGCNMFRACTRNHQSRQNIIIHLHNQFLTFLWMEKNWGHINILLFVDSMLHEAVCPVVLAQWGKFY